MLEERFQNIPARQISPMQVPLNIEFKMNKNYMIIKITNKYIFYIKLSYIMYIIFIYIFIKVVMFLIYIKCGQ